MSVRLSDCIRGEPELRAASGRAARFGGEMRGADRPRSRARDAGEDRGAHCRKDERAARQEYYSGALQGIAGRSADRFDRARYLRAASGSARRCSSDVRVRSIVGRFLEHSRIYYFGNGGDEEIYIGSADWMPRNLYERVEVLVPVRDEMLRERIRHEILGAYLADNRKARILLSDSTYIPAWQPIHGKRNRRPPIGAAAFSAQDFLMSVAEGRAPALMPGPDPAPRRRVGVGRER